MRKSCSSDQEKLLKFPVEGREFANFLRLLERFSELVNVQYVQFLKQYAFFTCSWSFLRSNRLEQLEFKLAKIIGI